VGSAQERSPVTGAALDAIVVGAGPNGLAAAIDLARAGRSVRIYEAAESVGGGTRSAELTLPGFVHDPCASVHPLSLASPFFQAVDLARHGLEWVHPDAPVAHALTPGRSVVLERDLSAVDGALGGDADAWRRLFGPYVREWERLIPGILGPVVRPPRHPLLLARFGLPASLPATSLARLAFRGPAARALFAGLAAHSMLRLGQPLSGSFGLVLGLLAHAVGWPMARGGSGAIAAALEAEARSLGVELVTGHRVDAIADLPPARAYLLDVTPRQVLALAGDRLPAGYRRQLEGFRYGPGVFKVDWALGGPIPWRDPATLRAATVHLGGTYREIASAEDAVARGRHPERPFVLLVQPTIADPSRAPEGKHVAWAYCHVPNGSTEDMTAAIEAQVERFAPGFRDVVLARATKDPAAMEAWDANYVGGDINGGIGDWRQLLFRPVVRWNPYTTPDRSIFLCSSSTPPGGGVHGMSGRHAARAAERRLGRA
jgi:phytoene dehydrogenase-like protein